MRYPDTYPSKRGLSDRQHAWVFLFANQRRAPVACMLWLHNEFERLEISMTAKMSKKSGTKVSQDKATWTGFANINLSTADKEAIKGGVLDGDSVLDIIGEMLGTGHKISLSYDSEKDTFTGAATGVYAYSKNAGLTLTCFARTLTDLLTVLAYKHEVVSKGNWNPYVQKQREPEDIG